LNESTTGLNSSGPGEERSLSRISDSILLMYTIVHRYYPRRPSQIKVCASIASELWLPYQAEAISRPPGELLQAVSVHFTRDSHRLAITYFTYFMRSYETCIDLSHRITKLHLEAIVLVHSCEIERLRTTGGPVSSEQQSTSESSGSPACRPNGLPNVCHHVTWNVVYVVLRVFIDSS
jgi:hypothetical protein